MEATEQLALEADPPGHVDELTQKRRLWELQVVRTTAPTAVLVVEVKMVRCERWSSAEAVSPSMRRQLGRERTQEFPMLGPRGLWGWKMAGRPLAEAQTVAAVVRRTVGAQQLPKTVAGLPW